jgi:hypothetical protein
LLYKTQEFSLQTKIEKTDEVVNQLSIEFDGPKQNLTPFLTTLPPLEICLDPKKRKI